jgi:hypothetical protein
MPKKYPRDRILIRDKFLNHKHTIKKIRRGYDGTIKINIGNH